MPSRVSPDREGLDAQRQEVAHALAGYLQKKKRKPTSEIQIYADRIRSGEHDDFMRQISFALQDQSHLIMADLGGEPAEAQSPEIPTLLLMHDANVQHKTASSRRGQQRARQDSNIVLAALDQMAVSQKEESFVTIPEPYPPCTAPLESLEVIKLSQLTTETHHRGEALFIERIGPLIVTSILTLGAVKDVDGDAEAIEIYHADPHLADMLPASTLFFLKEPFLTRGASGKSVIRVDHPADIVGIDNLPKSLSSIASDQSATLTALEWKEIGNGYFTKQEYFKAGQAYQSALKAGAEDKLLLDVSRNLARVELALGRYEKARTNALAAISNDESDPNLKALDVKAYFRAASASYQLRHWAQCEADLRKLLALSPNNDDGVRLLGRVQARLSEQKRGVYDFPQLLKRLSRQQPRVDIADFTKRTLIGSSKGRGRGLFAAEDITLGELILVEKAFVATFEWESTTSSTKVYDVRPKKFDGFPAALWQGTVQKLQHTPPQTVAEISCLTGRYSGLGSKTLKVDGSQVVDAFQIHDIIAANAFAIPSPAKTKRTEAFGVMKTILPAGADPTKAMDIPDNCAFFSHASLVNHSCLPNATRMFIGDAMVLRATKNIAKGEEILHAYVLPSFGVTERQMRTETVWGFRCDCKLCEAESEESEEVRGRRAAAEGEAGRLANDIVTHLADAAQRSNIIRQAERLYARLKGTFDLALYEGLPRAGMTPIQAALAQVYCLRGEQSRCRTMIVDAFDCLGWTLSLHKAGGEAGDLLSPKAGHQTRVCEEMVGLLATACRVLRESKKDRKLAEQMRELARTIYIALNSVENGIEKMDAELDASKKTASLPLR
ncbi:hypothetical protein LTR56_011330 [Elasticomyces elasticus]|nr:hypothetical protein LTR56_011330 [Elasticomyces elasticus]KAK3660933.1 hypothetical protein LTR22_007761 [Elasticomyces elasticus]KAK4932339.1 hypothetical protein LTR49_001208 [Elasticomyces elasticus]KAK5768347.1 hypothetical protein LTS12_001486 [Elasticomyces elasticus]